jgi:hypothetical protein
LKIVLNKCGMQCSAHVGGLCDADKFIVSKQERNRAQKDLHRGIELSKEVSSSSVSFHPPFSESRSSERIVSSQIGSAKTCKTSIATVVHNRS